MDSRKAHFAGVNAASRPGTGGVAVALALVIAGAMYTPSADARWRGHGARIAGGVVLGAMIARPVYAYARPVYYAPPAYYPSPVYYSAPAYYPPAPVYYPPAPAVSYANPPVYLERRGVPPAASLSVEERLRRLQSLCSQGLLSAPECTAKRQELLRLM